MKTKIIILTLSAIILFFSAFLISCKKSDSPSAPDDNGPIITAAGIPNGEISTASIGPSGGILNSVDGKFTLSIPAGALSSATEISIQPITNEAPLGLGSGYRLLPEGITFAKPAELTFHYDEQLLQQSSEDVLWIVTQDGDGSWNALLSSAVDTIAKTVSVTTAPRNASLKSALDMNAKTVLHSSDYVIGSFVSITLKPASALVLKGQSIELAVSGFLNDYKNTERAPLYKTLLQFVASGGLDILAPKWHRYEKGMLVRIKDWSLNGVVAPVANSNGSLGFTGKFATYTAPGQIPSTNPVNVSAHLEGTLLGGIPMNLSVSVGSHITVVDSELYILLRIDGKEIKYTQYGFNTSVPPDPTNYSQVICGTTDNEFEILASMVNTSLGSDSIFEFTFENPSETTRILIGSHKNGHDKCVFSPSTGIQYDLNYTQRTRNQDNTCDMQSFCSNITATLITYSGPNSVVRGSFSGTFYEDKPGYSSLCTMPDLHSIQGEFLLKMAY